MFASHQDEIYNDRSTPLVFLVVTIITACIVTASPSYGAPAPLARAERKPLALPRGECTMNWQGTTYYTEFRPDGSYVAQSQGGVVWLGTWELRGRTLTVRERPGYARDGWAENTWIVELDASLRRSVRGVDVRLE